MGCVATTRRFFPDGRLSRKRWKEGLTEISAEFQQFATTYRERGWQEVIGSSGTIKAIGQILSGMKLVRGAITDSGLAKAREAMLEFEHIDAIDLPGLSEERRPVMPGGLLIMEACFNELRLKRMQVCQTAMREGVLYDMLGRAQHRTRSKRRCLPGARACGPRNADGLMPRTRPVRSDRRPMGPRARRC